MHQVMVGGPTTVLQVVSEGSVGLAAARGSDGIYVVDALGVLRLRTARLAHAATQTPGARGESSLHFRPEQSGHAPPQLGRTR